VCFPPTLSCLFRTFFKHSSVRLWSAKRFIVFGLFARECPSNDRFLGILRLPFLDLAISKMQEASHWPTYYCNVMSKQRKSDWQHPNTYYRKWEETPGTDKCETSQYPHPDRTLPTKAVQIMTD
jgi:hypothetical protein